MKKTLLYAGSLITALSLNSCDDLFEPAIENQQDIDAMYSSPTYAQGMLANAYILLPYSSSPGSDMATDDAVANIATNSYSRMATGSWAADSDPIEQWRNRYNAIQYCNIMIENADKVQWADSESLRKMFCDHFLGESYGLRALNMYYLLRAHAGYNDAGELLGVQIHNTFQNANYDFNQARAPFKECVDSVLADLDRAEDLLQYEDKDISSESEVPAKYKTLGADMSEYNRAFGKHLMGKVNGKIVEAIRAQVLMLAASPAYSNQSGYTYEDAAKACATVLNHIGGPSGIDADGYTWYANTTEIDNMAKEDDPQEIIWRGSKSESNTLETNNYPPSLYGGGLVNPTQNLIDAFPMANGYPITETASGYNASDPYADRDPRFAAYIIYNGVASYGAEKKTIITGTYGTNTDVINKENGASTRTGYYLRKLLRSDINLNPSNSTTQYHYTAYIRYTEIFLDFAEAANEAYGPTDNRYGYSAYDVIKAIRQRAGVGTDKGDAYLESIKNDQSKMRELIRNERRIELCFENHRFYDLRRWNVDLSKLNESARGMQISEGSDGTLIYTELPTVEKRDYKDYMYYGPIPYTEIQKYSELQQNKGW